MENLDKKKSECLGGLSDLGLNKLHSVYCSHCSQLDNNIYICDCQNKILNETEQRFKPKKIQSEFLSDVYLNLGLLNRSVRVRDCGSILDFGIYKSADKPYRLLFRNFCKDRLCPSCNWRRSMKIFTQVNLCLNRLHKDNYDFLFLTLTVKNCNSFDLPKTIDVLLKGYFKLFHDNRQIKKIVKGSFRSLEITVNEKTGLYHPHLHCILAVNKSYFKKYYIKQSEWAELWQNCINIDYMPIVDVRKPYVKKNEDCQNLGFKDVAEEVSKYVVKGSDFLDENDLKGSCDRVSDFLAALTNRRLVSFTGVFAKVRKNLNLDDPENGDLINTGLEEPRADLLAVVRLGWVNGGYVVKDIL